jgi:two-component system cell cycle sensor histidine kinase/response regulator CckA
MEQLVAKLSARAQSRMSKNLHLSKTVLLVDDLDILRRMIRDFLKSLGMEILETSNAAEAIHVARSYPGTIDLLLTDIDMPRMSGWESAKQIGALRTGIRILYMSGGISLQEWKDFKGKPVGTYFIQKPFRLEELKALLMAILSE